MLGMLEIESTYEQLPVRREIIDARQLGPRQLGPRQLGQKLKELGQKLRQLNPKVKLGYSLLICIDFYFSVLFAILITMLFGLYHMQLPQGTT